MLQQRVARTDRTWAEPIRVVIESERLAAAPIRPLLVGGIEVVICSGPRSEHDACPLVTDARCPAGECDVVVSSLQGPWAASVHNAWVAQDTVATRVVED